MLGITFTNMLKSVWVYEIKKKEQKKKNILFDYFLLCFLLEKGVIVDCFESNASDF